MKGEPDKICSSLSPLESSSVVCVYVYIHVVYVTFRFGSSRLLNFSMITAGERLRRIVRARARRWLNDSSARVSGIIFARGRLFFYFYGMVEREREGARGVERAGDLTRAVRWKNFAVLAKFFSRAYISERVWVDVAAPVYGIDSATRAQ